MVTPALHIYNAMGLIILEYVETGFVNVSWDIYKKTESATQVIKLWIWLKYFVYDVKTNACLLKKYINSKENMYIILHCFILHKEGN